MENTKNIHNGPEKQLSSKKEDCTRTFKRMTRLNMSGYPDKIIDNNLLEVKNDHKRTSLCLVSTQKKCLNGIWFLIESQLLLSEIVIVYIIKDLSTCVIY